MGAAVKLSDRQNWWLNLVNVGILVACADYFQFIGEKPGLAMFLLGLAVMSCLAYHVFFKKEPKE